MLRPMEHDWEVECAFQRAAEVMVVAAEVGEKIEALMAGDSHGVRKKLRALVSTAGVP